MREFPISQLFALLIHAQDYWTLNQGEYQYAFWALRLTSYVGSSRFKVRSFGGFFELHWAGMVSIYFGIRIVVYYR